MPHRVVVESLQPHTGANQDLVLGAASMIPHAGVLEMMGQVGFVTWPEAQREGQVVLPERLVFPPVFLSRANASTQHTALERTLEPLNFTFLGVFANMFDSSSCRWERTWQAPMCG